MWPAAVFLAVIAVVSTDPWSIVTKGRNAAFDLHIRLADSFAPQTIPSQNTPAHNTPAADDSSSGDSNSSSDGSLAASPPDAVVLVSIDKASLERLGPWPWPRTRLAELVDGTRQAGARAVLLDQTLAHPDPTSPQTVSRHLASRTPFPDGGSGAVGFAQDHDQVLARVIGNHPVVLPAPARQQGANETSLRSGDATDAGPSEASGLFKPLSDATNAAPFLMAFKPVHLPLPRFSTQARAVGLDGVVRDRDGAVRRLTLMGRVGEDVVASDLLETLFLSGHTLSNTPRLSLDVVGAPDRFSTVERNGVRRIETGPWSIPVSEDGTLHWFPHESGRLRRVSAWEVLETGFGAGRFANSIAVIAPTTPVNARHLPTPVGQDMPSGEIKAMALDQILSGRFLDRPDWASLVEDAVLLGGGVICVALAAMGLVTSALVTAGLLIAGMVSLHLYGFSQYGWLIDPVMPGVGLGLIVLSILWTVFARASEQRRHMLSAIGRHLPLPAVSTLSSGRGRRAMAGELRKITVMACDLRGYPSFAAMHRDDPAWMAYLLQRFHAYVVDQVVATGGVSNTHQGTGLIGFWNAPMDDPDHAKKACDCALRLLDGLDSFNKGLELEAENMGKSFAPVSLSIGINTGHALVGDLGMDRHVDYTAQGDPVLTAHHLKAYSEIYGSAVIVGEHTFNVVRTRYALLELDMLGMEGRDTGLRTFALMGNPVIRANPRFKALEQVHRHLMEAYRSRDWDGALERVNEARSMKGAIPALYGFYTQRIGYLQANPPGQDWDGVFRPPVR